MKGVKVMTKEQAQERFEWKGMSRSRQRKGNYDVSINSHKDGTVGITFRNKKAELIGDRLEYAIFKNRVLFRYSENGMALHNIKNNSNNPDNCYAKFAKSIDDFRQFIGDYDLKYDDFYELYYIEKED